MKVFSYKYKNNLNTKELLKENYFEGERLHYKAESIKFEDE